MVPWAELNRTRAAAAGLYTVRVLKRVQAVLDLEESWLAQLHEEA